MKFFKIVQCDILQYTGIKYQRHGP